MNTQPGQLSVYALPYLQVASASQDPADTGGPVEPGYEVTKRAPTTNFVGRHRITQIG